MRRRDFLKNAAELGAAVGIGHPDVNPGLARLFAVGSPVRLPAFHALDHLVVSAGIQPPITEIPAVQYVEPERPFRGAFRDIPQAAPFRGNLGLPGDHLAADRQVRPQKCHDGNEAENHDEGHALGGMVDDPSGNG